MRGGGGGGLSGKVLMLGFDLGTPAVQRRHAAHKVIGADKS